jgi:hypothetical protein
LENYKNIAITLIQLETVLTADNYITN